MRRDKSMREKVLPVSVALDADGKPSAPLAKKLLRWRSRSASRRSAGTTGTRAGRQGGKLLLRLHRAGCTLQHGLQAALDEAIAKLPIPEGDELPAPGRRDTVQFVRPAHRLVALHGNDVVPIDAAGPGRRPHHARPSLPVAAASSRSRTPTTTPARSQAQGKVIASFTERASEKIRSAAAGASRRRPGADAGSAAG